MSVPAYYYLRRPVLLLTMNQPKVFEKAAFYTLLAMWLLPVWTVSYLLTGDGPCHLYNSRLLLDWIKGDHVHMYRWFMTPNPHLNPNWLTNLIQVPLLAVFPPAFAEKVFYTLYVLGFALGFRFLIKQLNPQALYLCSIGLIFAWHHIVFKGFSNNTLSIAVWFWIVGCWLRYREAPFLKAVIIQMLVALLGFLSHPMGFIYSGLMIACLLAGQTIAAGKEAGFKNALHLLGKQFLRLFVAYIPALALMAIFISRRSWSGEEAGYNSSVWQNLLDMPALIDLNNNEALFAKAVSIFCLLLLIITIRLRFRSRKIQPSDGLYLFLLIVLLSIFFPPGSMLGGLDVPRRLVMLPFLAVLFCAATVPAGRRRQLVTIVFAGIVTVGLLAIRLPAQWAASAYTAEFISCKDHIAPYSTVMTINFDPAPRDVHGKTIIDAEWLSGHMDCYMGTYKPLILADNYELNFDYFPFMDDESRNFYFHSKKDEISFEGQFPRADLAAYKAVTGIQVDYVIMAGRMTEEQQRHPYTQEIIEQLRKDYRPVYTTPHGIATVYRHVPGFKNPWK